MMQIPIKTTPRGRTANGRRSYSGGGNTLIPSTNQTLDRKRLWPLDKDIHRNVTAYGRRTMMSYGRSLYCSYNVVRGAVNEMAETATNSFVADYRGANPDFEALVHAWLALHDRTCDIAGPPYNMRLYRRMLVSSVLVDGDIGTLYVRDENGVPKLQTIPSHRIASAAGDETVQGGGPFDGARIIDGVILGEYNNAIGYRILTGDSADYDSYVDVSSNDMTLHFLPQFTGQVRGLSQIGYGAFEWQDIAETKRWEMLAQKAGSGRVFQIYNAEGEPEPGADYMTGAAAGTNTSGTPTGLWQEMIDGATNTYFKSTDPNQRIEAIKFDRPSSNQARFQQEITRESLYGIGWSVDYSLIPIHIGGASVRMLVDKINGTLNELQELIVEPAVRRFDQFRIPVAMLELKQLPYVSDWAKMEYQPPAKRTADRKYDSDVNLQEVRAGLKTRGRAIAERQGETEEDVRIENEKSVRDLLNRAKAIAADYATDGITIRDALTLLESPTSQGFPPPAPEPPIPPQNQPDVAG